MCAIESYYPNVGVGKILKRYLEYFSSYKHFSKLKRTIRTWVQMTKYDQTLTYTEGQTEEGVCAIERSNPKAGVSQILKACLEYFSIMYTCQNLNAKLNMGWGCMLLKVLP